MKTNVTVIIPNWNGAEYIAGCLESLEKQSLDAHIIVVENGSSDDSTAIVKEQFTKVELLEFKDNAGFAGGVNRGIQKAMKDGFQFIALFNNDAIADKNWLKNLVKAAKEHEKAGIITGKLMRMDKKHIDSTGDFYSTWGMPFPRGRNQLDSCQFDTAEYVFAASGGASLYRAELFKDIGLFDEDFFAYFEDVDISFRAQLAGWKVWYEPAALAFHRVSATSSKLGSFARYHSIKNFIMLYKKNMPGWLLCKYLPQFTAQLVRMKIGAIRDGEFLIFIRSFFRAVTLIPSTLRKRRRIQSRRTTTSSYIDSLLYHGRPPKIPKI